MNYGQKYFQFRFFLLLLLPFVRIDLWFDLRFVDSFQIVDNLKKSFCVSRQFDRFLNRCLSSGAIDAFAKCNLFKDEKHRRLANCEIVSRLQFAVHTQTHNYTRNARCQSINGSSTISDQRSTTEIRNETYFVWLSFIRNQFILHVQLMWDLITGRMKETEPKRETVQMQFFSSLRANFNFSREHSTCQSILWSASFDVSIFRSSNILFLSQQKMPIGRTHSQFPYHRRCNQLFSSVWHLSQHLLLWLINCKIIGSLFEFKIFPFFFSSFVWSLKVFHLNSARLGSSDCVRAKMTMTKPTKMRFVEEIKNILDEKRPNQNRICRKCLQFLFLF